MGGAGSTRGHLPALRGGGSCLEIAERGGGGIARLLGQPFVLAADRTRTGRRGGAKSAARRAPGLVLVPAQPFACLASGPGRRVGSDALRGLDLSSPSSRRARYRRSITSKEQGPQRGGKRGNGLPAVD